MKSAGDAFREIAAHKPQNIPDTVLLPEKNAIEKFHPSYESGDLSCVLLHHNITHETTFWRTQNRFVDLFSSSCSSFLFRSKFLYSASSSERASVVVRNSSLASAARICYIFGWTQQEDDWRGEREEQEVGGAIKVCSEIK